MALHQTHVSMVPKTVRRPTMTHLSGPVTPKDSNVTLGSWGFIDSSGLFLSSPLRRTVWAEKGLGEMAAAAAAPWTGSRARSAKGVPPLRRGRSTRVDGRAEGRMSAVLFFNFFFFLVSYKERYMRENYCWMGTVLLKN